MSSLVSCNLFSKLCVKCFHYCPPHILFGRLHSSAGLRRICLSQVMNILYASKYVWQPHHLFSTINFIFISEGLCLLSYCSFHLFSRASGWLLRSSRYRKNISFVIFIKPCNNYSPARARSLHGASRCPKVLGPTPSSALAPLRLTTMQTVWKHCRFSLRK